MNTRKSADERARLLIAASTFDQKIRWLVEQAANDPNRLEFPGGVVYDSVQVPCTPTIQYTDGPATLSGPAGGFTAFPAPIAQAATWDAGLNRLKGRHQAYEAFNKHRNILLAPGLGSGRTPLLGRNSEYMGEDPVLAGVLAGSWVRGIQEDSRDTPVGAVLKHYVANEQELDRQRSSSNVDERTLRQIYTLPFEIAARRGKPSGVMCSFNQINSIWACEHGSLLREILKRDIGFDGWVVSDFGSVHSVAPSLVAGLDQELNRPRFFAPANLKAALAAGEITEAQVDEAAFRVVRAHIRIGLFDHPLPAAELPDVRTPQAAAVARKVVEEGAVLLKNSDRTLPLRGSGKTIAVIGPTASGTPTNGVSARTVCAYNRPTVACTPVAPLDGITARAARDGSTVVFNDGADLTAAADAARGADTAIVFGYYVEGEFADRPNLNLDNNGDALVAAVAAANPNTVVVLQTGGPVLMPWLAQVKSVLEVWYAGDQMGTAIANLLWGDVNPSGRLPQTFPKSEGDLPTAGSPAQYPGVFADGGTTRPPGSTEIRQVEYSEGLQVGYRWYDAQGIEPLFPFGHGLSYTTFSYSHLRVTHEHGDVRVKFRLTNTGRRTGTEVAQVYVSLPASAGEPPKRLVGWARVTLDAGRSRQVEVTLDARDIREQHLLSYWDTGADRWTTPRGTYTVRVGASATELPLRDTFRI